MYTIDENKKKKKKNEIRIKFKPTLDKTVKELQILNCIVSNSYTRVYSQYINCNFFSSNIIYNIYSIELDVKQWNKQF